MTLLDDDGGGGGGGSGGDGDGVTGDGAARLSRSPGSFRRFPGYFGGVKNEMRRRRQFWRADWEKGLAHWSKTLSAALFLLFATLFSTVALGALVEKAS